MVWAVGPGSVRLPCTPLLWGGGKLRETVRGTCTRNPKRVEPQNKPSAFNNYLIVGGIWKEEAPKLALEPKPYRIVQPATVTLALAGIGRKCPPCRGIHVAPTSGYQRGCSNSGISSGANVLFRFYTITFRRYSRETAFAVGQLLGKAARAVHSAVPLTC